MTQTLGDSSKELKNLLLNVSEQSTGLLKETEESKKSFQKDIDSTADKLHFFTDRLSKIISEFNETTTPNIQSAIEQFNKAGEQQKQIVAKNEQYINSLDNFSKELKAMSLSMSETIKKLPEFITQINQSNELLKDLWGNYEKRFANVDESAKQLFENTVEGLRVVSKDSAEYIAELYKQSSKVSNNFAQAVEELQESISELSELVNKLKPTDS